MRKLATAAALVVLIVVVWMQWPRRAAEPERAGLAGRDARVEREATSSGELTAAPRDDAPQLAVDAHDDANEGSARSALAAPAPPTPRDAEAPKLAEVRGRFLLPGGAPAAGVVATLHGWPSNDDLVRKHGVPADWQDPAPATSDAEGRFAIALDPPRAFQFTLAGELAGYGRASWRWSSLPRGEVTDVGDVPLAPEGVVLVRLVDGAGAPRSPTGWVVYGDALTKTELDGLDQPRAFTYTPEPDGRFRLAGLPVGRVQLTAQSGLAGFVEGPRVTTRADAPTEVDLRYDGPDGGRRIVVSTSSRPYYTQGYDVASIRLLRDGVELARADPLATTSQRSVFDDVEPGRYTVEIEDPRFALWTQDDVEPGRTVRARLRGPCSAALEVVDAASGAPVPAYALRVRLEGTNSYPDTFEVKALDAAPPAGHVYEGLLVLPQTLIVSAPGHATREVPLPDLVAYESRRVRVELERGVTLAGTFTSCVEDAPIARARVLLLPRDHDVRHLPLPAGTFSSQMPEAPEFVLEVESDEAGRFAFAGVPPGAYLLYGVADGWTDAGLDVRLEATDAEPAAQHLVARAQARWRGRVRAPDGADPASFRLVLTPRAGALPSARFTWPIEATLDAAGRFDSGLVPAGELEVGLAPRAAGLRDPDEFFVPQVEPLPIGRVTLDACAVSEAELDATAEWPGALEVRVRAGALPAGGVTVEAWSRAQGRAVSDATTDADGLARVLGLPQGDYLLFVRSNAEGWIWCSEEVATVRAGATAPHALDYHPSPGALTLLDAATGAPLGRRRVALCAQPGRHVFTFETDAEGRLQLTLPMGRYEVLRVLSDLQGTPLEWTAGGPVPDVVRLAVPQ
ncbi:MAG: hypothetical protein H6828_13265 [Planctomycetes bacterium]|nr:hypothetical protein [Planctomycetota bacterium]